MALGVAGCQAVANRAPFPILTEHHMNNILQFAARPPKPKAKGYMSLSQAERQRCAAILLAPEARGLYAAIARDLAIDTDLSADAAVDLLRRVRATAKAQIAGDTAAGRL
jgi:hypothetical protein